MSGSNIDRFYSLPSLSLLSRHMIYPTTNNLPVGLHRLLQYRNLVNHVPKFFRADAAAFFPRRTLPDVRKSCDSARNEETESPVNLCTTIGEAAQRVGDSLPPAWPLFSYNEPIPTADSSAVHGVGVFQRLLALMSRRASALDCIQKRHVRNTPFSRHYSASNHDALSLSTPELHNVPSDQSTTDVSEQHNPS